MRPWALWTGAAILAAMTIRWAVNALGLVPVHFDEAQYWAYGQELAWGYFSKPPLVAAAIRLSTDLLGDTLFAVRLLSPVAHGLIGWLIFLIARRLFDGRTGFWAAMAYTLAPGVGVSAMLMTTDPIMMIFWALALYAFLRAEDGKGLFWWGVMGAAIGLGMLAKYTMVAFVAGLAGFLIFSSERRDWKGLGVALAVGALCFLPNVIWNANNGFATLNHVAEDAAPGGSTFNPGKLAEFLGAQLGVIGIAVFGGILWAFARPGAWRQDRGMRLVAWQTAALLLPMIALAFVTRAQPNWAAPAYIGGTIFAVRFLLERDLAKVLLWGQLALSGGLVCLVWLLALVYSGAPDWPRAADPFKKMRIGEPFCEIALGAMAEEGAEVLLSTDRRRLSECMFLGGLSWDEVAVWNPEIAPENHHELVATLYPGDERRMLLAVYRNGAEIAAAFRDSRLIDEGSFPTHADRDIPYSIWSVQGFKGY